MPYAIETAGKSRSFPDGDPFSAGAVGADKADVLIYCGVPHLPDPSKAAILIELGAECLGDHTGEAMGDEGSNVLGFARYRNGRDAPSNLVEIVRQPATPETAVAAARAAFEAAGFAIAVCSDQAGRIVDRLVRPKYNDSLRLLDEGLATQKDIDLTCRLGLGYADGPIERVVRGGLDLHHAVSAALFETYGTPAYAPGRRGRGGRTEQVARPRHRGARRPGPHAVSEEHGARRNQGSRFGRPTRPQPRGADGGPKSARSSSGSSMPSTAMTLASPAL